MLLLSMVAVSDCLELKNGSFLSLRSKTRKNVSNFLKEIFFGRSERKQYATRTHVGCDVSSDG